MNRLQWNNMQLTSLNKGQPNTECVNAQIWISKVISMLRDGKSPDADELHPEVIKRGNMRLVEVLYIIIKDAPENIEVSADWKYVQLVTIFKNGKRRVGNYRGIFSPYQGKCLLAYCSTDYRPKRRISYLKYIGGSMQTEEPRTWSSCDKFRRNAMNKICPTTWYLSTLLRFYKQGSAVEHPTETRVPWPLY